MACAFIVPALFNLTAQAAVLGASGREQRLSTLRLLGLSSHQVERMAAVETGIQALIGIVLGWLVSRCGCRSCSRSSSPTWPRPCCTGPIPG